jgi:3-hydroxyacyl-CoA dehydrogenase/enoyl-CoA hydratase/3-hydroxybutyryl-CoA epimerase
VFRELDRHTRAATILATNTSSLGVVKLQEGTTHPERIAGLHFFNPVHKMPLVEVARTQETEEGVAAALARWAVALGKTPVLVRDSPGLVVNRVLMPYLNEAVLLLGEGLGIEAIDQTMRRFGMPMGPLELLDQVGIDVAAHVARSIQPVFGDRFPPSSLFERMAGQGWLGQKRGIGFYRYHGTRKRANRAVLELVDRRRELTGELPPAVQAQQARERLVLVMVNEAARCLGEGLVERAEQLDLAMVLGTGWAPHRGGPLRYADDRGPAEVVRVLSELAARLGPRFEPSPELRRRAGGEAR